MLSSTPPTDSLKQWGNSALSTIAPPVIASVSIIPTFADSIRKSALQTGQPKPRITWLQGCRMASAVAAPYGVALGAQLMAREQIERSLVASEGKNLKSAALSSAITGALATPIQVWLNSHTMPLQIKPSLRALSLRQWFKISCAIATQESCFLWGLSAEGHVARYLRPLLGDNLVADYTSALISSGMGSLMGHPCNTAWTRWQRGMQVEMLSQLKRGALYRLRATLLFTMTYKIGMNAVEAIKIH